MRLPRLLLAAALVASGSLAVAPATATEKPKTRPACHLLVDASGDGHSQHVPVISSQALDILSGDLAVGTRTVVIVLAVSSTDLRTDPWVSLGYRWTFTFALRGVVYTVTHRATRGTTGAMTYDDQFTAGTSGGGLPRGSAVRSDATSYTWVLPRSAVSGLGRGAMLTDVRAATTVGGDAADDATRPGPYGIGSHDACTAQR
jgi:hypothetical protein